MAISLRMSKNCFARVDRCHKSCIERRYQLNRGRRLAGYCQVAQDQTGLPPSDLIAILRARSSMKWSCAYRSTNVCGTMLLCSYFMRYPDTMTGVEGVAEQF
jgi:hypothetical protein